jgi:cell division transport system permease protein
MISSWLSAHSQAGGRALQRLGAQPLVSVLSIAVIGISIMLPLGLYVFFESVAAATVRFSSEPNVSVYLQVNAKDSDVRVVEKSLNALSNAGSVTFISREAALLEMRQRAGIADFLTNLDSNPLPNAFSVRPKSVDSKVLDEMRIEISAIPMVEFVVMDFEWARKLKRFTTFSKRAVVFMSLVLAVAVIFVTGNTIRLQMLTQREEIEVSRLIGATNRFVKRPFLYFGAMQGLLAGALAILGLTILIWFANIEVHALTSSYDYDFSLNFLSFEQITAVIAVAMALGWTGAFVSVSVYLRNRPAR